MQNNRTSWWFRMGNYLRKWRFTTTRGIKVSKDSCKCVLFLVTSLPFIVQEVKHLFELYKNFIISLSLEWEIPLCSTSSQHREKYGVALISFLFVLNKFCLLKLHTVKHWNMDTRLTTTPRYYGQFILPLGNESPYIFSISTCHFLWPPQYPY